MKLSEEQQAIVDSQERNLAVNAYAGSGKSSTLVHYAKKWNKLRKLYLCFNKSVQLEAEKKFREEGVDNIQISTAHSLAYQATRPKGELVASFRLNDLLPMLGESKSNRNFKLYQHATKLLAMYCNSSMRKIEDIDYAKEVSYKVDADEVILFAEKNIGKIIDRANKIWQAMGDGKIPITHDYYLKLYQLSEPKLHLHYDLILFDEGQDANRSMADIFLKQDKCNKVVIGDIHQCVLPSTRIKTKRGAKAAKDVRKGDKVLSATGLDSFQEREVLNVIKNTVTKVIVYKIITKTGRTLTTTGNHKHFSSFVASSMNNYYVYLMYSHKYGYRIGTSRTYSNRQKDRLGYQTRLTQEKAQFIWIIGTYSSEKEARYYEILYSLTYQIPTLVFFPRNNSAKPERGLSSDFSMIDRLYSSIDTRKNVQKLFLDFDLKEDSPHYSVKGYTSSDLSINRKTFSVVLNGHYNPEKRGLTGVSKKKRSESTYHTYTLNLTEYDAPLIKLLEKTGYYVEPLGVKAGRTKRYYRVRGAVQTYQELIAAYERMKKLIPHIEWRESAKLNREVRLQITPARNLLPGMSVFTEDQTLEEITRVERVEYSGEVYDFEVDKYHNYFANGICTHNSIYGWRGAFNILSESGYPTYSIAQSFRFPPNIAFLANEILNVKRRFTPDLPPFQIKGTELEMLRPSNGKTVYLGRTNLAILQEAFKIISTSQRPFAYEGSVNSALYTDDGVSIYDVYYLFSGKREKIRNDFIKSFGVWKELLQYVKEMEDFEIGMLVNLVKTYQGGIFPLISKLKEHEKTKDEVDLVFSTGHKSKGLEYERVHVMEDFISRKKVWEFKKILPTYPEEKAKRKLQAFFEEINLLYVAATRTMREVYILGDIPTGDKHDPDSDFQDDDKD